MKNKEKKPLRFGRSRVPVIMQLEALECGAACLAMISAFYGKWVPLEQVRTDCGVSRDGSNAKNVLVAARSYGLNASGYRMEPDDLVKRGRFPCIIHWNFNHFVVLDGFHRGRAVLNDPARGTVSVSMEEFDQSFTGICLMFEPNENFVPGGKPKSVLRFAADRLKGNKAAMLFVVLSSVIAVLLDIIRPAFSRIFVDRLLTNQNPEWFYPFLAAFATIALIQILVSGIQTVYSNKLDGKMAVIGNMTFLWKLMHLPMEFFSQRMVGDIQSRQNANASIAGTLIQTFAPLVLNLAMLIFYLVVMIRYSWILTLVGISSIVINMLLSQLVSARRVNMTRVQIRDMGKLASATVSGIEMIETIKASGAENGFFEKWSGYQASVNTQTAQFTKSNMWLVALPAFVSTLTNTVITMLGVFLIINGQFTEGMLMAFQAHLASFMAPAESLISAGQTVTEMRTDMERIDDVMQYPDDPCFAYEQAYGEEEQYAKLTGNVELKNVSFGYSRLGAPLIQDFSMTMKPGSRVAIVGASGSGKSTISKLISGLYQPWSGQILFDGVPASQISRSVFTGSLAVVDQEVILFEDTIANNIKMWDESIEDFEMILAARDAQLHDDIMQREGGYRYKIREGGVDFSGGQRQRMEIARVLAQDPTIIIMDEATSALDAKTEYDVVKAIQDRGITCIVVAHRLSTIRDCDEIIVLDNGVVVERGTHEELMALGGRYMELITSD